MTSDAESDYAIRCGVVTPPIQARTVHYIRSPERDQYKGVLKTAVAL